MGTCGVESTEKGLNCLEVLEEGNLERHLCLMYLKIS